MTTEEGVCEADEIVLWVYGEEANTGPLILWSGEQNGKFQAGSTDDFKVRKSLYQTVFCLHHLTTMWPCQGPRNLE